MRSAALNRTMMELKSYGSGGASLFGCTLNRTMMELKLLMNLKIGCQRNP